MFYVFNILEETNRKHLKKNNKYLHDNIIDVIDYGMW